MSSEATKFINALSGVIEPSTGKDILRLNWVRNLVLDLPRVSFDIVVDDPGDQFSQDVQNLSVEAIKAAFGPDTIVNVSVDNEMIGIGLDVQGTDQEKELEKSIRNTIAVASGKGGVGKSTVTVNLAVALAKQGYDVGIVDTDIYGPSMPTMLGIVDGKPRVNDQRQIIPLEAHGVKVLSMGFLVEPDKAVIWRGPMVTSAVRQFLTETDWGELDFLLFDLPPGTGDIQLTIVQTVPLTGAVIVSTPQQVALADARKGVAMFEQVNVPVLGIVENMAFFTPPDMPDKKYHIFGDGGAARLARDLDIELLGQLPIEQDLRESCDSGVPQIVAHPDSQSTQIFDDIASQTVRQVYLRNVGLPATQQIEILHR
ncbi:MAG: Mrp/NBP35 family ATP-binding protein [Rhodothermales bacterium]|nr:Mrp/NBP35 family ATP-binding protein [Rhodothermales bacterium]